MEALAGCNPVAYGKWFDSTVPHEEIKTMDKLKKNKPGSAGPESEGR